MCTHKDSKEFDKHIIVFFHQHSDSQRVISLILVEGKRRFGRPTNKLTTDEQYLEIMSLRNGKNLTKTWPIKFIWAFSWSIYYLPEASSQMFFVEEQLSKSILRRGNNKEKAEVCQMDCILQYQEGPPALEDKCTSLSSVCVLWRGLIFSESFLFSLNIRCSWMHDVPWAPSVTHFTKPLNGGCVK